MSHGLGISPTFTCTSAGARAASASRSAARRPAASVARKALAPKLRAKCEEVGVGEVAGDQPVAELLGLDAAHVAEGAVVEHHRHHRQRVAHGGGQFLRLVHEPAVAADAPPRRDRAAPPAPPAPRRSPSPDCPGSPARCSGAAPPPGRPAGRMKPTWVTSSTTTPSSGRAARRARRKPICGSWRAIRSANQACAAATSSRGARGRLCAGRAASRARSPSAASASTAASGRRKRDDLLGVDVDADDLQVRVGAPHRLGEMHPRADAEHRVGLLPQALADRQRGGERMRWSAPRRGRGDRSPPGPATARPPPAVRGRRPARRRRR